MKTKTKILTLIILLNGFLLKAQTWDIQGLWKVVDNVFDGTTNRLDNLNIIINNDIIEFYSFDSIMANGLLSNDTVCLINGFEYYDIDYIFIVNSDSLLSSTPNLESSNNLSFTRIDLTGDWEQLNYHWKGGISRDTCEIIQARDSVYFYKTTDCFATACLKKDSIVVTSGFDELGIDYFSMYSNDSFDKVTPLVEAIDRVLFLRIGQTSKQVNFPDSNAIWNVNYVYSDRTTYEMLYGLKGDTLINDTLYNKLYTLSDTILSVENLQDYIGGFRQEGQKVWFRPLWHNQEILLYDFSVSVGDTVWHNGAAYYSRPFPAEVRFDVGIPDAYSIILEIEVINGIKTYKVENRNAGIHDWYTGIGTKFGLFGSILWFPMTGDTYNLACFKHNDTVKYQNNLKCNKCFCGGGSGGIDEKNISSDENVRVYPVPSNGNVIIELLDNDFIDADSICIYNEAGELIKSIRINGIKIITINQLTEGIYVYQITFRNGQKISGKIIKLSVGQQE